MASQEMWNSQGLRQMVIQQIEDTYNANGNPMNKTSHEVENTIFEKAQSRDDYLQMVARLILNIKEIRGKRVGVNNTSNPNIGQLMNNTSNQMMAIDNNLHKVTNPMVRPPNAMMRANQQQQMLKSQEVGTGQPIQVTLQGGQIISQQVGGQVINLTHQQQQRQMTQPPPQQQVFPQPMQQQNAMIAPSSSSMATSQQGMLVSSPAVNNSQKTTDQVLKRYQISKQQQMQQQLSSAQNSPASYFKGSLAQQKVSPSQTSPQQPSPLMQQQTTPSPAFTNPPSVGPSTSPLTQTDEIAYMEKLKEMSKYVEPLSKAIAQIQKGDEYKKDRDKMTGLLDIINKNRRVLSSVLNRCELVLKRLFPEVASSAPHTHSSASAPAETVAIETTPVARPPSTLIIREVVTTMMTSAHLMSEARQKITPGMIALHAPMINPPPPFKRTRRRRNQTDRRLPLVAQRELVHLQRRFHVELHPVAEKTNATLICRCRENLHNSSSIRVHITPDYPRTEPYYDVIDSNAEIANDVQRRVLKHLMRIPHARTLTMLLSAWVQALSEDETPE